MAVPEEGFTNQYLEDFGEWKQIHVTDTIDSAGKVVSVGFNKKDPLRPSTIDRVKKDLVTRLYDSVSTPVTPI